MSAETHDLPKLVIYTYDSMVARGGLGEVIFPMFEKECHCRVKALPAGDTGQIISRMQLDVKRGKNPAQIVFGIDQQSFGRIRNQVEAWGGWIPHGYGKINPDAKIEEGFLPYDYGYYALMQDRDAKTTAPGSLEELLKPEYKRSVILEDPRTSAPGLAFMLYTQELLKDGSPAFWQSARSQWLTLAPGWDAAYGLFLKKEAPFVWSYTTSQAYHEENGDAAGRYRAVYFREGQPIQIEGAALIKGSMTKGSTSDEAMLARAKSFLEFLISPEVQVLIPKKNWMYPARQGIKLPPSFKKLPKPKHLVRLPIDEDIIRKALASWNHSLENTN